jgi:flagellar assembly factor FliW
MPRIQTECFGEIEFLESSVFHFPLGLPGFEDERAFVFLDRPGTAPLLFMQSLATPSLCFILLPILAVDAAYELTLDEEQAALLGLSELRPRIGEDVLCAAIVCAARQPDEVPTANLLAPVVVNFRQGVGMQAIQPGARYSHRHPLFGAEEAVPCS